MKFLAYCALKKKSKKKGVNNFLDTPKSHKNFMLEIYQRQMTSQKDWERERNFALTQTIFQTEAVFNFLDRTFVQIALNGWIKTFDWLKYTFFMVSLYLPGAVHRKNWALFRVISNAEFLLSVTYFHGASIAVFSWVGRKLNINWTGARKTNVRK